MKSTAVLRSIAVAAAAITLVGAVRSAAASIEVARESQRRIRIMVSPQVVNNDIDISKTKAIDVAIIYEPSWSFSDIDAQTIEFAGAIPVKSAYTTKDWDNDGNGDRTYYFNPKALKLAETDTTACLKLETLNKQKMSGCTTIKIVKGNQGLY